MLEFLMIAVIILTILIIGIIFYLFWLPVKIKTLIRENDQIKDAISEEEFEEEGGESNGR